MRYLTLSFFLVLSVGCGKLPGIPDTSLKKVVKDTPTDNTTTLCSGLTNALYCDDSGDLRGREGDVADNASVAIYAKFMVRAGSSNTYGRLVEVGGDSGPGGGLAMTLSGVFGSGLTLNCAWWDASLFAFAVGTAFPDDVSNHTAVCQITSSSQIELYLDGVLVATQAATYVPTTGVVAVGEAAYSNSFDFDGTIAEAAVFNSALSSSDLASLH